MKIEIEKIKEWLKNKDNLILILVISVAIIIRLYYFFLTLNQPLWWDEADYMMMSKSIASDIEYKFDPVRPVLFSIINGVVFKITGYNEFFPRLLLLIMSILVVVYTYLL